MQASVPCGCGCGFAITSGMRVRLIAGVAYALGCVSEPVLVDDDGPDVRTPMEFLRTARRH